MAGMEDVGLRAVVENVTGFVRDMKRIGGLTEDFAEKIFDLGTQIGSSGLESFGMQALSASEGLASLNPYAMLAMIAVKELGREIGSVASSIKNAFVFAINLAISILKILKNTVITIINVALSPFRKAWDMISNTLSRIFTIATGILTANTIRRLGQVISEAGQQALEAGINFQVLQTRLLGLAARQILNEDETLTFADALGTATDKSKQLLDWVVKLSLTAPISTDAIANTLTLATSYGLAEDAAKDMTTAVLTFSSGMGLTDLAQRRIIENFGQMIQQGKLTSQELRDMGRGAFVPVNDLLNRTAELLGMTADEFDGTAGSINAFAAKAGLDPTMAIMEAFIDLTEEEFPGAIKRMGSTIQGLRQRFSNLVDSIIGLNVLKPSLDLLGQTIGNLFDKIAESGLIQTTSEAIGKSLSFLVEDLLGSLPSAEEMVSKIEGFLAKILMALGQIRNGDYLGALATIGVPQGLLDFIDKMVNWKNTDFGIWIGNLKDTFDTLKNWWDENGDTIKEAALIAIGRIADALGLGGLAEKLTPENPIENYLKFKDVGGEGPDVDKIVETIENITNKILFFIELVQNLPNIFQELAPHFLFLAELFLLLTHPLLGLIALLPVTAFLFGDMLENMVKNFAEKWPEFKQGGKDLIQGLLSGISDWWIDKVLPWAEDAINAFIDLIPEFVREKLGIEHVNFTAPRRVDAPVRPSSNTNNSKTYNINVDANYSRIQSPAGIGDDLSVLLSGIGP